MFWFPFQVERYKTSRGPSVVRELASEAVDLEFDDAAAKLTSSEASEKSAGFNKMTDAETEMKVNLIIFGQLQLSLAMIHLKL